MENRTYMEFRKPIRSPAPSAVRPGRAYEYAHVGHPLYPAAVLMLTERQENISKMTLIYNSQVTTGDRVAVTLLEPCSGINLSFGFSALLMS